MDNELMEDSGQPAAWTERVGCELVRERTRQGLSAAALARVAQVDYKTIRTLESGDRWPHDLTRNKIEVALGLALGTIQGWRLGDPPAEKRADAGGDPSYEHLKELIRDYAATQDSKRVERDLLAILWQADDSRNSTNAVRGQSN